MSDRETVIVGSGERWLNGSESSKQYFSRAERAAAPSASSLSDRILGLLYRLLDSSVKR